MKNLLIIVTIFISTFSIAGNKITLIDRINDADKIPVYISHGKVKSGSYNAQQTKVPLTQEEANLGGVNGTFPSEIDSLLPYIMKQLKESFETDKFVFIMSGGKEEVKNDIKAKGYKFVAVMNYSATYGYELVKHKVKRIYTKYSSYIVAYRKMSVSSNIGFYLTNEKNTDLKNIGSIGRYAHDNFSFEVKGYTRNGKQLMKRRNPMVIVEKIKVSQEQAIIKLAEKQKKKHEKALKKRNK